MNILGQLNALKDQPELFENAIVVLMGSFGNSRSAKKVKRILTFAFEAYGELMQHISDAQDATKPRSPDLAEVVHSPDTVLRQFRTARPPKQQFLGSILHNFSMLPKFDEHKVALAASTSDMEPAWSAHAKEVERSFTKFFREEKSSRNDCKEHVDGTAGKEDEVDDAKSSETDAICKGLVDAALQEECRKGVKSIECEVRYAFNSPSIARLAI